MPILSVIVPTYNRPDKLLRAISGFTIDDAIIEGVEVCVVSDSPHEDIDALLFSKYGRMANLSVINNSTNLGAPTSRNKGLDKAKGAWVLFLDDDDFIDSASVRAVVKCIATEQHGDIGILHSKILPSDDEPYIVTPKTENFSKRVRRYGQESNTSSMVFRHSLITAASGWDENLVAGQDTDLILRLAPNSKPFLIAESVVVIDQKGRDRITDNPKKQMRGKLQFLRKNYRRMHPLRSLRYIATLLIAYPYLKRVLR